MTLAELSKGQKAIIQKVNTMMPGVCRLMVLGLVEGTPVEYRGAAIGGDPIEVSFYDIRVSMRLEQAQHFDVDPVHDFERGA